MKAKQHIMTDLFDFLDHSPTSYQAAEQIEKRLVRCGFQKLIEKEIWKLEPCHKYFVSRNQSSIIAFIVGSKNIQDSGFHLIGAHTDSPSLKLKTFSEKRIKSYIRIGVEVYGGPIISTWIDRDLSIAGRIMVWKNNQYESIPVDLKEPLAIIPNAAIHLNREINSGFEYNKQTHLPVLIQVSDKNTDQSVLLNLLARHLKVKPDQIGEYDLFLYDVDPARYLGMKNEFFSSGRLDDLSMCHSILSAMTDIDSPTSTAVGMFYDNEEIGSMTRMGAASGFLRNILERIVYSQSSKKETFSIAMANSFFISADMAHALHPNYIEKHDEAYAPLMNGGPVIKQNANFKYATTAESSAYFEQLCKNLCMQIVANNP
ncbi:MAG TPA: M18 family aminopeptidase, partial [Candidatus Cloacimonadota bacterium]|nr:M18 family aminopeptidase [Candidatus Cloacimonadota bacterium]